ncbi:MAG TPA: hypothetical protein VGC44_00925, partial [Longimicrobiales bacterium]
MNRHRFVDVGAIAAAHHDHGGHTHPCARTQDQVIALGQRACAYTQTAQLIALVRIGAGDV